MENLSWEEVENKKPEDILTEKELKTYKKALSFFEELFSNSSTKQRQEFSKSMLGINSARFARRYSDPYKEANLYKKIYQIMNNYNYNKD